jgi:hypothetical protein
LKCCANYIRSDKSYNINSIISNDPSSEEWRRLAADKDCLNTEIEKTDIIIAEIVAHSARLYKQKKIAVTEERRDASTQLLFCERVEIY